MHILKCTRCNKYTLKEDCPVCGSKTVNPKPARYSPEDSYGRYRRLMKQNAD
ncbi:MAG: ribosome biogenesis protein [Candidatus Altiarchaeales archaeon ex4484_2]|nr:MAG: ribosome biogenesis protein [Candidatus Altiarchaeales archaeon ex4484_2]